MNIGGGTNDTRWFPLSMTYFYLDKKSKDKIMLLILLLSEVNERFIYKLENEGKFVGFSVC